MPTERKTIPFGLHLTLDMYNFVPDTLNDKALVSHILNTLAEELEMKKLIEPVAVFAQPNGSKDLGGWSGFAMIQESHISIHTFIKRRFVSVDVYSCKQFDTQAGITYFKEDIESTVEVRGKKYSAADID